MGKPKGYSKFENVSEQKGLLAEQKKEAAEKKKAAAAKAAAAKVKAAEKEKAAEKAKAVAAKEAKANVKGAKKTAKANAKEVKKTAATKVRQDATAVKGAKKVERRDDKAASKVKGVGKFPVTKLANANSATPTSKADHDRSLHDVRKDVADEAKTKKNPSATSVSSIRMLERVNGNKFLAEHVVPSYKVTHNRGDVHVVRARAGEGHRRGDERFTAYHRFPAKD